MTPLDPFPPTRHAALERIGAVRLDDYALSRNALEGAVSYLSPYITHGLVSLTEVLAHVTAQHPIDAQHKFVFELGWREYFRHVWRFRGAGILKSLHDGLLPDDDYAKILPTDIREAATGVPVIDQAVRTLYGTGYLHNHARLWLASYMVHIRKLHWRVAADWLYGHLLDGDLASNHLSWQWVAGTGSRKAYLFNAENVARYARVPWHSPGSIVDASYEALDKIARTPVRADQHSHNEVGSNGTPIEPALLAEPPAELRCTAPDGSTVAGQEVWLVHPWNLGELPLMLAKDTVVLGVLLADFHHLWPWSDRRWRFVGSRMSELAPIRWYGDSASIGAALKFARNVRSIDDPHLQPWLSSWADCEALSTLFPAVARPCDSFSQWWSQAMRGIESSRDLLTANPMRRR